jgi:6-phosphogluconolactonase
MSRPASSDLRVYADLEALSQAVAQQLAAVAAATIAARGGFSIALCGGQTPRRLYRLLATEYRDRIPWPRVEVFWGDERYVPHTDPRSDYRMARDSLLEEAPIPPHHVHPMPTDYTDPAEAAQAYERLLKAHFPYPWPCFDLVLLGLGAEGHTASLFPHSPALRETARWVVATEVPVEPKQRLTLTLPAINQAARVWFLVAGAEKAQALKSALAEDADIMSCPAAGVKPISGELVWWVDEAATAPPPS